MRLQFYENALGKKTASPIFSPVTSFKSVGVVMNIFLLDPSARLLSAFVWVSNSNTIGLYVLLDWEKDEYVFIDTGIECVSSNIYIFLPRCESHDHTGHVVQLVLYSLRTEYRYSLRRFRCCFPTLLSIDFTRESFPSIEDKARDTNSFW